MYGNITTDRLVRLLIADFRYSEAVDESIWLDHARRANGRVIFYPNGQVSSIEHDQFSYIPLEDEALFDEFMRFIKPATKWERFTDWASPLTQLGCALIMLALLYLVSYGVIVLLKSMWSS